MEMLSGAKRFHRSVTICRRATAGGWHGRCSARSWRLPARLALMNPESPVTLRKTTYRGVMVFHLSWEEDGTAQEKSFPTEGDAVVEMAAIEERLRVAASTGKGLTVNPFGLGVPFITSKDVHFASLKLQPRGLTFRESITDYVAAVAALQGTDTAVPEAAREYAEASKALKPFDVSLGQAVFEWAELKKQVGDKPLFEVLRAYLKLTAGATEASPPAAWSAEVSPGLPASVAASAPGNPEAG